MPDVFLPGVYIKGTTTKTARTSERAVELVFEGYVRVGDYVPPTGYLWDDRVASLVEDEVSETRVALDGLYGFEVVDYDEDLALLVDDEDSVLRGSLDDLFESAGGGGGLVPNIVFEGDSLMVSAVYNAGVFSPTVYSDSTAGFVLRGLDPRTTTYSYASFGKTTSQMITSSSTMGTRDVLGANNIAIYWGGTNDFSTGNNVPAATVLANIATWVATARAAGFKVVTTTLLPRSEGGAVGDFATRRSTVNAALVANAGGIYGDVIANPAADTRIGDTGDSTDATYYDDQLHMKPLGYAIVAQYIRAAIAALGVVVPATDLTGVLVPQVRAARGGFGMGLRALDSITTGANNVAIGPSALEKVTTGANNSAIGQGAGAKITTGQDNVAIGWLALNSDLTGSGNVALGTMALLNATAGSNIGIGFEALKAVTSGSNNVGIGAAAGTAIVGGLSNTAVGGAALGGNVSGHNNVAIGKDSIGSAASGDQRVAIGVFALRSGTGSDNVAIGHSAAYQAAGDAAKATTTATRQVFIGAESGQNSATQRNDVVGVGYRALVDAADTVALGSGAQALHSSSVALGKGAVTTLANQVMVGARDVEITDTTKGIVLKSPDGTRYRLKVANGGAVSASAA